MSFRKDVNFGTVERYHVMQTFDDHQIQYVDLDSLPYSMRGILRLDKLRFANIRF